MVGRRQLPVVLGLVLAVAAAVVAIEVFRPLAGREEQGPASDPLGEATPVGEWTLLRSGPDRWRELVSPDGERTVLQHPPRRIVSQVLLTDEVLTELCPDDRVVANSRIAVDRRYSNIADRPGGFPALVADNAEAILALHPDVIFAASYTTIETLNQLRRAEAPVIRFSAFDSLESISNNLRLIGFAVGEDEAAEALVRRFEAELDAAAARVPVGADPPEVVSWSDGSLPARGTIVDDVLQRLGVINIPAREGMRGWPQISVEKIVEWDPEVIILPANPGDEAAARARFTEHALLSETRAVREGRLIVVPTPIFIAVSHHAAQLAALLVGPLYGLEPAP